MIRGLPIKLLAIGFAVCLLSFVPTAVLAHDNGMGGSDGNAKGNGNSSDHGKQWKDNSESGSEGIGNGKGHEGMEEGYRKHLFGHFNLTDGVADGKFITFGFDAGSGNVSDYALRNDSGVVTFFDSIQILGFEPTGVSMHGAVMLVQNSTVQVIIHDNPTGMFHVVSNETNTTVSFLLAPGMSVLPLTSDVEEAQDREHNETEVEDGDHNATYSDGLGEDNETEAQEIEEANETFSEDMDHDLSVAVAVFGHGAYGVIATDEGNITLDANENGTWVNVTISQDHVVFRARPAFSHHQMSEDAILQAISEGKIAGEISLVLRNGTTSYDTMEYRDQFRIHLLSAEQDHIRLQVEDQDHNGKVVIINVDDSTLNAQNGELELLLDGVQIKSTTNPLEVLYAQGSEPSDAIYCVIESNGVNQFLVYVPSFSTHELSVSSFGAVDSLLSVMGIVAVVGALALVALAGFMVIRRKH